MDNDTTYELIENKVASLSSSSTDIEYPTSACVYRYVGEVMMTDTQINELYNLIEGV